MIETQIYPLTGFSFSVSVGGSSSIMGKAQNLSDASFQEVSGISVEIPFEPLQEGGENRFAHRLPLPPKYPNLVLKRGVVSLPSELSDWCSKTVESGFVQSIELRDVVVMLLNEMFIPVRSWTFFKAYPVKWDFSSLNSTKNELFIESIELAYQYFSEQNMAQKILK